MDTRLLTRDSVVKPEIPEIFKGFPMERLQEIAGTGVREQLEPKRPLFHQGTPAKNCYLVNRGRLKLTKLSEQGKEVIIRYAGAGEFVAATAIFEEKNYPLTAEAVVSTEVTGWERRLFSELMARYPGITMNLLAIVLERIDDVQNRYLELCAERVEQRIARSLLRLMRRAGVKTPEGIRVDFPLSRQNIADFSGTTLFTVSRTLSLWEKRGWILSGRERITVVDPHSLVLFSEKG